MPAFNPEPREEYDVAVWPVGSPQLRECLAAKFIPIAGYLVVVEDPMMGQQLAHMCMVRKWMGQGPPPDGQRALLDFTPELLRGAM